MVETGRKQGKKTRLIKLKTIKIRFFYFQSGLSVFFAISKAFPIDLSAAVAES